jgi:hypothetical protein
MGRYLQQPISVPVVALEPYFQYRGLLKDLVSSSLRNYLATQDGGVNAKIKQSAPRDIYRDLR